MKQIDRVRVNRPARDAVGADFIRYAHGERSETLSLYHWVNGNRATEPLSWERIGVPYDSIRGVHLSRQYLNDFRIYLPEETIHCLAGTSQDTRPLIEAIRRREVLSLCSAQDYYQGDMDAYFAYLATTPLCVLHIDALRNESDTAKWMAEAGSSREDESLLH